MKRNIIRDEGGHQREARAGEVISNPGTPLLISTDANNTLTIAQIQKGGFVVMFDAFSAGRQVTTDTAAAIIAAMFPNAENGDSFTLIVSIQDAFAGTWVAGTGVTLKGRATTPASGSTVIVVTKTSATTVDWFVC
jgi:hypothetical protein